MWSCIFLSSPRSDSTRSRMSGMLFPPDLFLNRYAIFSSISTYSGYSHGEHVRASPQGRGRPLAVDHLARVPVDQDVHLLLRLVIVADEPHGCVEELPRGLLEVRHERFEGVDALPGLLLRVLLGEALRELVRLLLRDVPVEGLDAAGLLLVVRGLALDVERVPVVRLVLGVPAHADDRDVVEDVDPVPHPDGLGLVHLYVAPALTRGGGRGGAGKKGEADPRRGVARALSAPEVHLARALQALDVRRHARRDDPVLHVPEGRLQELRVLRHVPAEDSLVEPLPARLERDLLVDPVVEHEVLLDHGPAARPEGRRGPAVVARDQGEPALSRQRGAAGGALEVLGTRGRVRSGVLRDARLRGRGPRWGCLLRIPRRRRGLRDDSLLAAAEVTEHGSIWNLLPTFLTEHSDPLWGDTM